MIFCCCRPSNVVQCVAHSEMLFCSPHLFRVVIPVTVAFLSSQTSFQSLQFFTCNESLEFFHFEKFVSDFFPVFSQFGDQLYPDYFNMSVSPLPPVGRNDETPSSSHADPIRDTCGWRFSCQVPPPHPRSCGLITATPLWAGHTQIWQVGKVWCFDRAPARC